MTADPDNVRDEGQRARAGVGGRSGTEHDDLAITLADLARSLQEEKDTSTVLERIVRAAIDLVPGCDEGSISMVTDRRRVESQVPSVLCPGRWMRSRRRPARGRAWTVCTPEDGPGPRSVHRAALARVRPSGVRAGRRQHALVPAVRRGRQPGGAEPHLLSAGRFR